MEETTEGLAKDLPYDLRQVYGVDLVGEHLKDIARARKADAYSSYYKCLKDLFIIVRHKIIEKKVKIKDDKGKEKTISCTEHFNNLVNAAVLAANKYPNVWVGADKNPSGCAEIELPLNDMEMFLYEKMEEANMFGSSKYIQGL